MRTVPAYFMLIVTVGLTQLALLVEAVAWRHGSRVGLYLLPFMLLGLAVAWWSAFSVMGAAHGRV